MSWKYSQSSGAISKDGITVGSGYSGYQEGLDNPQMEQTVGIGPIPQGLWTISGPPFDNPEHGSYCLRLSPQAGTFTFGRDGFLIHGDEVEHAGEHLASRGCIVTDRVTRTRIYQSGDTTLEVTP
jgi:hypothetical protein